MANFKINENGNVKFIRPSGEDLVLSEMPLVAVEAFLTDAREDEKKEVTTDFGKALEVMVGDIPYRFLLAEEPVCDCIPTEEVVKKSKKTPDEVDVKASEEEEQDA